MRHPLPSPSMLLTGLAGLALLLVGCQAVPSMPTGVEGGLSVIVRPEVVSDRRVLAEAEPIYTGEDVHHIVIGLYRCELQGDEVATEVEVASREVDNLDENLGFVPAERDFTFKNLHADTYYRIRGFAYSGAANVAANLISETDTSSAVDFETSNNDRPGPVGLRIRLADRDFDGNARTTGVTVNDGHYLPYGRVQNIAGHTTSDPDVPTPGTPLQTPSPDPLTDYVDTPSAVAVEPNSDTVWIADSGNNMLRYTFPSSVNPGYHAMIVGVGGSGVAGYDAAPTSSYQAKLNNPQGLAFVPDSSQEGSSHKLYIADTGNHCIRLYDMGTGNVSVLVGQGPTMPGHVDTADGPVQFDQPRAIAHDPRSGLLFVADTGNNVIRYINPDDGVTKTLTVSGLPALFAPRGVAVAGNRLFFTESHRLRAVTIRIEDGVVSFTNPVVIAGDNQDMVDGDGATARFNTPTGLAVDGDRNLFVSDTGNHRIRRVKFGPGGAVTVSTFAGGNPGRLNGVGTNAQFLGPTGLAFSRDEGLLFVADTDNHRIRLVD